MANSIHALSLILVALAGERMVCLADERPNVIVIMADDLGYGDLSCYGSELQATPNIDALAREGVRCTDFYVTSPVCTPTRVALLTGRHPVRVGFSTLLWPTTVGGLPEQERTLAEILHDSGYATGLIGKWHLGHSEPRYMPLANGFDYFYGMPYPNDMGPDHPQTLVRNESWPPMPMVRDNETIEIGIDVNLLTQQYTAEALAFIAREHHRPFFLFLSHAMPHTIIGASADFRGKSNNGLYGDAVQELDWSVGEVRRTLRAFGLEEKTFIVFTSDNGAVLPEQYSGKPEQARQMFPDLSFGSNGQLRGGKQSTFEGGVRLPAIFHWPGVIPGGQVDHGIFSIADVLPTVLDYLDIGLPDDRSYDGISLRRRLAGDGQSPDVDNRELYFGSGAITAARFGKWKLVLPRQPRFLEGVGTEPMLFDLEVDIGEANDLASEYPEQVREYVQKLEAWQADAAGGALP